MLKNLMYFVPTLLVLSNCLLAQPETPELFVENHELQTEKTLQTIAFGSCNKQDEKQEMWQYILANEPDLWIWLGDNIYGDSENMEVLERKYKQIKFHPEYQKLWQTTPIVGTWDDHDYGVNDGGKDYPKREQSKQLLLDFLDVPQHSEARQRPGAYQSYTFGESGQQVKVILLDARYFRDPLEKNPARNPRYFPNKEGDILGDAQWQWLEEELTDSEAQIHLIASGIQMIPEEHAFEKWANFPQARQRLFDLLEKTQPAHAILLSGDRHIAEVSRLELEQLGYPLYEITASGMTHSYEQAGDEPNQHRVSKLIGQKNFGLLQIDWSGEAPTAKIILKGLENMTHDSVDIEWE